MSNRIAKMGMMKKMAAVSMCGAVLVGGGLVANTASGGALGGFITGTTNQTTIQAAGGQFTQATATDITGANPGVAVTSSTAGTATNQLENLLPGGFASNQSQATFLKLSNTSTVAQSFTLTVANGAVKDATGAAVVGPTAVTALDSVNLAIRTQPEGGAIQSQRGATGLNTLEVNAPVVFTSDGTATLHVPAGSFVVVEITASTGTIDNALNGYSVTADINIQGETA